MPTEMQPAGDLSHTPLLDLARWILENRYTGVLLLARGKVKKSIVFEGGLPVAARSNIAGESLGGMLLAEGKLTQAQVEESVAYADGEEVLQGEALVKLGLIDSALLHEMLRRQLVRRIEETFAWTDGKYGFVSEVPKEIARMDPRETILEIAFRGLVRKYRDSPEARALDPASRPVRVGGHGIDPAALKLGGREAGLLRSITGVAEAGDLIAGSRIDDSAARATLLAFQDFGLVRIGEPEIGARAPSGPPPRPPISASGRPGAAPPPPKAPGPSAAARSPVLDEAALAFEASGTQNLFEVLGVDPKASLEEVKRAYFELARKFHPDRLPPGTPPEERKIAEAYFARISEASARLSNEAQRKEYEASLTLRESGVSSEQVGAVVESEAEFQKGMALLRKGAFAGAVKAFERAVELYDREAEHHVQLGWARFRLAAQEKKIGGVARARETVERGLKMDGRLAQGFYYLAMMAKFEGDLASARRWLEKTAELDPRHGEAQSELRLLSSRQQKEQTGGLRGLFGRKDK